MIKTILRHYIIDYAIKSLYDDVIKNFSALPCITYKMLGNSHIGVKCTSVHTTYGVFYVNKQFLPFNEDPEDYKKDIVIDIEIVSRANAMPHLSDYELSEYESDEHYEYYILITNRVKTLTGEALWKWNSAFPFDKNSIVYL